MLKTFSGHHLQVLVEAKVEMMVKGQRKYLPLVVIKGDSPLFGRNWLQEITITWMC